MPTPLDIAVTAGTIGANQINQKLSYERQKKLMTIQYNNQKLLDDYGQQLAMKTWKETNYPAQIAMMKEAGLSPSLIYGKGGGSGGTVAAPSGGSAQGGNAPQGGYMDLSTIVSLDVMRSQAEKNRADAKLAEVNAGYTGGVKTEETKATIENLIANAKNTEARTELTKVQTATEQIRLAKTDEQITEGINNIKASTQKLIAEGNLTRENAQNIINETKSKVIKNYTEVELTKSQTKLADTEREAIGTRIEQEYDRIWQEQVKLRQEGVRLGQKDQEIEIQKFKAEIDAKFPGVGQAAGMVLKKAYASLEGILSWTIPTDDKVPNHK